MSVSKTIIFPLSGLVVLASQNYKIKRDTKDLAVLFKVFVPVSQEKEENIPEVKTLWIQLNTKEGFDLQTSLGHHI